MTCLRWVDAKNLDKPFVKDLAAGRYQKVIKDVQKEIKSLSPFWEKGTSTQLSRYLQILATAYELNGNWQEALDTWALVYGDVCDEYNWAFIRILYASDNKELAFRLVGDMAESLSWVSVDNVKAKIGTLPFNMPFIGGVVGEVWDPEWLALVRFHNECARVICPELYYVSSNDVEREEEGTLDFTTLQCESYLKFIDFMQEQLEMSDELFRTGNEKHMKFVKEVKDFPYKCIHLGMEGGMEEGRVFNAPIAEEPFKCEVLASPLPKDL